MAKLTKAQYLALKSARDHGDPTRHFSGQSAFGGWTATRAALHRQGYLDHGTITELGLSALKLEERDMMRQQTEQLKCPGVGRDKDCISALQFYFTRRVTDDEMRFLHDVIQRAVACMPRGAGAGGLMR